MPQLSYRATGKGKAKYTANARDVVDYCGALETGAAHLYRQSMHDLDYRIWRLEKYTLEELKSAGAAQDPKLWPSFTSNAPRTYWNAIRRATTANPPRFRIQLPGQPGTSDVADPDYYDKMLTETSLHERFGLGAWQSVDEQLVRRGRATFQNTMSLFMATRGGTFIRPWYEPTARYPFQVAQWDPRCVAYEEGADGLGYVCHHYKLPWRTIADQYNKVKGDLSVDAEGNVEVFDAWWCEYDAKGEPHVWNCYATAGGVELIPATEHRDLDHVPVFLVPTFGAEFEENDYGYGLSRIDDKWETIYTANRQIYPWINRVLTIYGIYLRNHAVGPWIARNTGFSEEQLGKALRPFALVQSPNPNASIEPLTPPTMALEVKEFYNGLEAMMQRGSVPNSIFGQIPFELSGFAVNQLQGAISITAGQMTTMMGWAYRLATDELIQQFRQRGGKVTLKGLDQRRQQFIEDIKRADLRDKYFLEVEIKPDMPADKLQEAQVAQAWSQIGIDTLTILDEVLKVADPREVMKRIVASKVMQAEIEAATQQDQAEKQASEAGMGPMNGMPPEVLSPPTAGLPVQQFTPTQQNVSDEALLAAGFAGR